MPVTRRDFVRTLFVASQAALASRLISGNLHADELSSKSLNFAVIGDWGRKGRPDQTEVATQMALACKKNAASFVISLGDNFYDYGVKNATDPLFQLSFENVYTAESLQVPWYVILGNHDYRGNCDAQIEYGKTHSRWNMPSRYYSKAYDIGPATKAEIFYIDTNPFIKSYAYEPLMRANVLSQDTDQQLDWLDKGLAASTAPWKLVMGHHPIYSAGPHGPQEDLIARLLPVLEKHKVQAYFAGHDHDMEHLQIGKLNLNCFVSGGGSEHRDVKNLPQNKFGQSVSGFAMASLDDNNLQVQLIDNLGNLLYSANVPRVG